MVDTVGVIALAPGHRVDASLPVQDVGATIAGENVADDVAGGIPCRPAPDAQ